MIEFSINENKDKELAYIIDYNFHDSILNRAFLSIENKFNIALDDTSKEVIISGLKYFFACSILSKKPVGMPSAIVDEFWHVFLLYTKIYQEFCSNIGKFVHHCPDDLNTETGNSYLTTLQTFFICCKIEDMDFLITNELPLLFNVDMFLDFENGNYFDVEFLKLKINELL